MISGLKFLYFLNLFNNVDFNVIILYIVWCMELQEWNTRRNRKFILPLLLDHLTEDP